MKRTIAAILATAAVSFGAGTTVDFGNTTEDAKKLAIMTDYVKVYARLGEQPTIDISHATTDEWSQAYIAAAQEEGIDLKGKTEPTDLNVLLQEKASERNEFCADPNATIAEVKK